MVKIPHVSEEVEVPENVKVEISGMKVTVSGPHGDITRDFSHARGVTIHFNEEDRKIVVETFFADRRKKALVGTIASHIENMIIGVTRKFYYKLKIVYTHFPVSVRLEGDTLYIENFLGEKAPRKAKILPGVKVKLSKDEITLEGIDIEKVGQTAANIEQATKVRGRDRRVFIDGIYIYERGVVS